MFSTLHDPREGYECSKTQKFIFKILKMREKVLSNFSVFVLNCTKRRCSQIQPQLKLKVEIEEEIEAP